MICTIGIDPGPSTGIVVLLWDGRLWGTHAFQCTSSSAAFLLSFLIDRFSPAVVAIEEFEVRRGSGGTTGKDADTTKQVRYEAEQISSNKGIILSVNKPGNVKPWATDKRLAKIGFPLGAKFKDARDAARHALFSMVKHGLAPDPLR